MSDSKFEKRAGILFPLLLVFAGVIAYHNSFAGVFLLDDHMWIVENSDLEVLWPPTVPMGQTFRPLVFYSFAINRAISGLDVWSYHLVNLAIHLCAALALYGV